MGANVAAVYFRACHFRQGAQIAVQAAMASLMSDHAFRPLRLCDAPDLVALMRRAEGGLGRLPEEMDLPWMEEALAGALAGGVAIGAWQDARLIGMIKASRMPSVQFQHVLWDLTVAVDPEFQGRGVARGLFAELLASAGR